MRAQLLRSLFLSLTLVPGLAFGLTPDPVHSEAVKSVVESFEAGHYREQPLDDQLSDKLFTRYLDTLDPNHSYLLASDVATFEAKRLELDDELKKGELTTAYQIYSIFLDRYTDRSNYLIDKLESGINFSFDTDEQLLISREDEPWFDTKQEQDAYWERRIRSDALNLKLSDRTADEVKETLVRRYTNQRNRVQQTDSEDIFQTFTNVLASTYDPHTSYFSPQTSENFQINMSLSLEGIGAVLQTEDEFTKVVSLVPAGPADKSGQLKPADLIVGVGQGETGDIDDIVGMRLDDVVQKIRGPKDSIVRLEVIPSAATDRSIRRVIKLTRNRVQLEEQAAHSSVIEIDRGRDRYKLGVIDIPAFYIDFQALQAGDPNYRSTTRDVAKLIEELKLESIDGLIIDLRDNGGGSLREANELVGLFISRGPTVQIRDADGRVDILGDYDPATAWTGPLTVLVNRLSASASEIFAGAIQDYRRGLIVGSRTFGKGTVQTLQPLQHGQVKLTTAKFYRISGESTQHQGVEPDIWLPSLIDEQEIGESALDFALPWDQVRPVRFGRYTSLDRWIPELTNRHQTRTEKDPDFVLMQALLKQQEVLKEQRYMPLNEQKLRDQRDKIESEQLDLENTRRIANNLPPIKNLDELIQSLKTSASGESEDPNDAAIIDEAGELTIDMIEMFGQEHAQKLKS